MKLSKKTLTALLVLQVGFASFLMWDFSSPLTQKSSAPLLAGSKDQARIDRLAFSDGENTLSLALSDGRWWLDQTVRLPADSEKVEQVLAELTQLRPNWPVVTQASSHERFQVADDAFYRKVTWYQGDDAMDVLLIGDTPAMRQSYVRREDSDDVYALPLNRYDFATTTNAWLDKTLLQVSDARAVSVNGINAELTDGEWQLDLATAEESSSNPELSAIENAVSKLQELTVIGVEEDVDVSELTPTETLTVETDDELQYRFYKQENEVLVTRSDLDTVFRLSQSDYETFAALDPEKSTLADHQSTSSDEAEGNEDS